MNRMEQTFQKCLLHNRKAFVPYIMGGDGGIDKLKEQLVFLEKCGASGVEIGVPFSDPAADGPVIQEAGSRALAKGVTLKAILEAVKEIRPIIHIPIVLMSYLNPIISYGFEQFTRDAGLSGVDGCIIPDLPIEEVDAYLPLLERENLELIRLVTVTTPLERIKMIAKKSKGYLYAVTVAGTTGTRTNFDKELGPFLKRVKEASPVPVLAGFGITTPEQVKEVGQYCDGVIVGSKIVDLLHKNNLDEIETLIQAALPIRVG